MITKSHKGFITSLPLLSKGEGILAPYRQEANEDAFPPLLWRGGWGERLVFFCLLLLLSSCAGGKEDARKRNFDDGWAFYRGSMDDIAYPVFDDADWRKIDLPHDWSVEPARLCHSGGPAPNVVPDDIGPFSRKSENGIPTGHTLGGEGWYQKRFTLSKRDMDKRLTLYFEGIYMESDVWVNGRHVGYHPYGYTSFMYDITGYCHPAGKENVITVRVRNTGKNSRWYAGSGIYRHVWLLVIGPIHFTEWGTWVQTPSANEQKAEVRINTEIANSTDQPKTVQIKATIADTDQKIVGESTSEITVDAGGKNTVMLSLTITNPGLWSVEHPNLYTAGIEIMDAGKQTDHQSVTFGIRTLHFSAAEGFKLNGIPMLLKGGCIHHDNGLLGAASIDRAEERKVELLKANGYNAVRCAHNPPSEAFLDACDRLGLLVIDEAFDQWIKPKNPDDYHRFFEEWSERDIASMVLRDRNHPGIIAWSIGNEIRERADEQGVEIARQLKSYVRQHDDTRPVTAAVNDFWDNPHYKWGQSAKAFEPLDIAGYNYMWWEYENDIAQYPERIIYGSETTAGEAAVNWDLVEKHTCIIGEFVWTALDYLGESGIGHAFPVATGENDPPQFIGWPWFNAWCGDIDLCGDKKSQSYYRDVIWRRSPVEITVHTPMPEGSREKVSYWGWPDETPCWNWKSMEGKPMSVNVYTRYPSARLYLNGKLTGEKAVSSATKYTASFSIPYSPGELKAVGVKDGREKESKILVTTGKPERIRLTADRSILANSRNDLSYVKIEIIDTAGNVVPYSNTRVQLSLTGTGEITASGNASPTDMESFRSPAPKVFRGRALAILRPLPAQYPAGGEMTLTVAAEGLPSESLSVRVK